MWPLTVEAAPDAVYQLLSLALVKLVVLTMSTFCCDAFRYTVA